MKEMTKNPIVTNEDVSYKDLEDQLKQEIYARQGIVNDYWQFFNGMNDYAKWLTERYMAKNPNSYLRSGFEDGFIWIGNIDKRFIRIQF